MAGQEFTPRQMIEKLVAFDTTSSVSNLALIEFVAAYLDGHGIEAHLIHDSDHTKANLFATVGPARDGGVALSGHTDVVPVAGQSWDTDPFAVVERDGRLYGRGTADMKSFIAIALALVPEMKARTLDQPIHFAFSYDEEIGCLGAPRMIREIGRHLPRPAIVIVGEPTSMKVANAHKGSYGFRTVVTGLEAHSSATHRGVNAIMYGAEIIHFLGAVAAELKERPAAPGMDFDPPYATLSVGRISGGTALNIIPLKCEIEWEFRLMPGGDPAEIPDRLARFLESDILPRMRAIDASCGVETVPGHHVPPLAPEADSPAEALARALTGENRAGVVAFGAEAGQFQQAGMSTVLCGPGDIAQAHKPNEFIELEQIEAGTTFMRRLIDWAARD